MLAESSLHILVVSIGEVALTVTESIGVEPAPFGTSANKYPNGLTQFIGKSVEDAADATNIGLPTALPLESMLEA